MQLVKRGFYLLFKGSPSECANAKKVFRKAATWYPSRQFWSVPATLATFIDAYRDLKSFINMEDAETAAWVKNMGRLAHRLAELQHGKAEKIELPTSIDYVWDPLGHQREAIAFALNIPKSALWLDMGLGKTYTSITLAKLRHAEERLGNVNRVLVIAPRSLLYQWETEIHTLAPEATVTLLTGTPMQKKIKIAGIQEEGLSFTLVTYEGLHGLYAELVAAAFDMFILDEATKIKNPKAVRTKATVELCQTIPYGVELTGMAYVGNPLDLYAQFLAVDDTIYGSNQYKFSEHYIDYGRAPFGKFIRGFKNIENLKERAYYYAFSRTKDQCLDLPPKTYQTRKLPLFQTQYDWYLDIYNQVHRAAAQDEEFKDVDDYTPVVTVEYAISMLEKFQQITSGFLKADNGDYLWLDSPKYDELVDVIRSTSDSVIIWARHTFVLKKIKEFLYSRKIDSVILDRRVDDARRKMIKREFNAGKIKVLILQISSECRGNDFTCKTNQVTSIFFENTASIEERSQAEDRHHRIGMTGTSLYVDLVCEFTWDENILALLEAKKTVSTYIKEQGITSLAGDVTRFAKPIANTRKTPKFKTPDTVAAEIRNKEEEEADYLTEMDGVETF